MVHSFVVDKEYFLFDVESSSLFEVDKLVYDIVNNSSTLHDDYSNSDIETAKSELDQLVQQDVLNTDAPQYKGMVHSNGEVKAICMHLSHDCNLRCKYCFAGTGTYHGERMNMSQEVAFKTVDFLVEHSGNRHNLEIDFFGGEPLLNYNVLQNTVDYCKEMGKKHNKNFKLTTTTNGVLLSQEVSQYLNQEMDNVVLSLDGRREVNDSARPTINGKGSYDAIIDKIKYFVSIRGDKSYYVRGTYTADNIDFDKDVMFLAQQGFQQISVEPVVLQAGHPMELKPCHIGDICDNYEKLAVQYVKCRQHDSTWFSFFHFTVELDNGPCYHKRLVGCGAGDEYLAVTPDGNIYPCHQFAGEKEYCLGNVADGVLDSSIRDVFCNCNLTTKPDCANCWAKYHCSGGCSANAVHYNNDINKPYQMSCELMKKRLECALYVYAKENAKND